MSLASGVTWNNIFPILSLAISFLMGITPYLLFFYSTPQFYLFTRISLSAFILQFISFHSYGFTFKRFLLSFLTASNFLHSFLEFRFLLISIFAFILTDIFHSFLSWCSFLPRCHSSLIIFFSLLFSFFSGFLFSLLISFFQYFPSFFFAIIRC